MSPKRRFAALWAFTALGFLLAVGIFNRLIDPYGLWDGPTWPGVNQVKIRPEQSLADIKLANALRRQPDALILGNSRADIGFDPQAPPLSKRYPGAYNLAVPGGGLETSVKQLEILVAHGIKPRLVIVGVEFFDFLNSSPPNMLDVEPAPPEWEATARRLKAQSIVTLTALGDSISTLGSQSASYPAIVRNDGFNPLLDYIPIARNEGYFALFRQRAIENSRRMKSAKWPADLQRTSSFLAFQRLIALSEKQGIRMELAIYPYHAQMLGLLAHYRLLPAFQELRVYLASAVAVAAANGARIQLWDFSLPSVRTAEAVPSRDDRARETAWYWEAGHFKASLGELVLNRLTDDANPAASDFGIRLAPNGAPLQSPEMLLDALWASRPDLKRDVDEVIQLLDGEQQSAS